MNFRPTWRSVSASVFFVLALALPAQAQSSDWQIQSFRSDIVIHTDASMLVTETVRADFSVEKHGIFRIIPWRYATEDGGTIQVPIVVSRIERNGKAEPYTASVVDDNLKIQIGDAEKTITGPQVYTIVYRVKAVVNFFDDHTELYWNVTGNDWEVPLNQVKATVQFSVPVADASGQPPTISQTACFTGAIGSTRSDCAHEADGSKATFASQDFMSIVVGWPNGIVIQPANYDQLRSTAGTTLVERVFKNPIVFWGLNSVFPFLVLFWLVWHWRQRGRDVPGKGTVIAQYDPPAGLTPGEMGTLYDEHANHRDVIATIVDLAVRGYLTITEVPVKKIIGKSMDYRLDRASSKKPSPLKAHEETLLGGLFADGDHVKLSELRGTFADDLRRIQAGLYAQVRDQGYFTANPNTVRILYVVLGLVFTGAMAMVIPYGILGPAVAGLFVAMAGPFMPKRTAKGAEALWHAKGFKLFLEKAEKYRIRWQEKENIFEAYLPYAMAFGVADKWTKAFEGLQHDPPNWYRGSSNTFNTVMFWSAMNSFSTASAKNFAPPASSGSSGFGGGGFSGGGFGGGGGGSW